MAARLLDAAVPREGTFSIPTRYLTNRDLAESIGNTFVWQNARAKSQSAEPAMIEYHQWTLLGSLQSEDVWESTFRFAINAESQAIVELPDLLQEPDVVGEESTYAIGEPSTYAAAIMEGKRRLMSESAKFVNRIEVRLERDRKRLQDYYRTLSQQASGSKRRTAAVASPEEIAAKKQAVDLELRRKLLELNEHYALRASPASGSSGQGPIAGACRSHCNPAETSDSHVPFILELADQEIRLTVMQPVPTGNLFGDVYQ